MSAHHRWGNSKTFFSLEYHRSVFFATSNIDSWSNANISHATFTTKKVSLLIRSPNQVIKSLCYRFSFSFLFIRFSSPCQYRDFLLLHFFFFLTASSTAFGLVHPPDVVKESLTAPSDMYFGGFHHHVVKKKT